MGIRKFKCSVVSSTLNEKKLSTDLQARTNTSEKYLVVEIRYVFLYLSVILTSFLGVRQI